MTQNIYFNRPADDVARLLVGTILVVPPQPLTTKARRDAWDRFMSGNNHNYKALQAKIIETEGFETDEEITVNKQCLLASPGEIALMPYRHQTLLNIGSLESGKPSCVMIRSISVNGETIDGPGRVSKILHAEGLEGAVLNENIPLKGKTVESDFIAVTSAYSTGRYRIR